MIGKIWNWLYESNEVFWGAVIAVAAVLSFFGLPALTGWLTWWLSGSALLTFIAVVVPIAFLAVTTAAHLGHPKGIRGWWHERPWKKMERV